MSKLHPWQEQIIEDARQGRLHVAYPSPGLGKTTVQVPPSPESFAEAAGNLTPEQARREACVFTYTNHRDETEERRVFPLGFWWGSTEWHPEPQILFRGWDLDRDALRDFAVSGIVNGEMRYGDP